MTRRIDAWKCFRTFERLETELDLLGRVITGDVMSLRVGLGDQTSMLLRPEKAFQSKFKVKVTFLDMKEVAHCEFLPQGQTIGLVCEKR